MLVALIAALAMVGQDITATYMVVAEARGNAVPAGLGDAVQWLFAFATGSIAYSAVIRHGWTAHTFLIVGAITVANVVGTIAGVRLGRRFTRKDSDVATLLAWRAATFGDVHAQPPHLWVEKPSTESE